MNKKRTICIIMCVAIMSTLFVNCSRVESTPVKPSDFRVTAYLVCGDEFNEKSFDTSNLDRITDIIIFGNANFDEKGSLILADNFDKSIELIHKNITDQRLYLNILGPSSQSSSDDWNEQMYDLADRHTKAFESGKLEKQIKSVLGDYNLDGIVFDYEFPLRSKDWRAYDRFIISLRNVLGNEYKIGMSMVSWNLKQSKKARQATDFFEVMSYDLWDDDGYHATMEIAQEDIEKMARKGYDKSKLDLGIPFYARPTTKEAYWYDYKAYYDKLGEDGLAYDDENGLTISFNTYDMVNNKTLWALDNGVGGVMIWHYNCDVPAENALSLFGAINSAITSKKEQTIASDEEK